MQQKRCLFISFLNLQHLISSLLSNAIVNNQQKSKQSNLCIEQQTQSNETNYDDQSKFRYNRLIHSIDCVHPPVNFCLIMLKQ